MFQIYQLKKSYHTSNQLDRINFTHILYNLANKFRNDNNSFLNDHQLIKTLQIISKDAEGTFTPTKTAPKSRNEFRGEKRGYDMIEGQEEGGKAVDKALEAEGYELISDVIETKGGVWEHAYKV